ncbi:MAG: MarC family protein [Ignavibacteriales bacterium]|nr:MarC family protein [Ignavibacteriales bacterium]
MNFDLNSLLYSFIPLFVAIDVLGIVPVFLSLTTRMNRPEKHTLITQATLTALAVSVLFVFGGRLIFNFLGITENDFRVGGGIVLLVLAVTDLLFPPSKQRSPESSAGVVPIGIPLIVGPAALTTILILVDSKGYVVTILSLLANLLIVWIVFRYSEVIVRLMGEAGSKAVAKVAALFMAGIAVMMIRVGLSGMIKGM